MATNKELIAAIDRLAAEVNLAAAALVDELNVIAEINTRGIEVDQEHNIAVREIAEAARDIAEAIRGQSQDDEPWRDSLEWRPGHDLDDK